MDFPEFLAKALLFIVGVFLSVCLIIYSASVFYDVWGWFAVPVGIPALVNKWHGMGLITLVSWPLLSLALGVQDIKDTLAEGKPKQGVLVRLYTKLAIGALSVSVFWGFGAVYHYLMLTNAF